MDSSLLRGLVLVGPIERSFEELKPMWIFYLDLTDCSVTVLTMPRDERAKVDLYVWSAG
jgi:hypothetical protein